MIDSGAPRSLFFALAALLLGCSGSGNQSAEFPSIDDEPAAEVGPLVDGDGADLSSCRIESQSDTVVDLRCPEAALSEMRSPSRNSQEDALAAVIESLRQRYGHLEVESSLASLDGATVTLRTFRGDGEPKVSGMVAALSNKEQMFWAVACFREDHDIDLVFCRRAVASIGRNGGATAVGAAELTPLQYDGVALEVAPGCKQSGDTRIECPGGELSWVLPDGRDARELRDESAERLRKMASEGGIQIAEASPACTVRGAEADCLKVTLVDPSDQSQLVFLLAIARATDGEMMTVCTYPGAPSVEPPAPCDQILSLKDTNPAN